jgi:hypothetical protein
MYSVIGSFTVYSGVLRVTDPCYTKDTRCAGKIENVELGRWVGVVELVEEWGIRSSVLYITVVRNLEQLIEDIQSRLPYSRGFVWEKTDIDVGVDSGQAGFFDERFYPEGKIGEYGDETTFYGKVCKLTAGGDFDDHYKVAGTLHFGAVSSSGFGDGSYNCYVVKDESGVIIAAKIVFLDDEDGFDEDTVDDE